MRQWRALVLVCAVALAHAHARAAAPSVVIYRCTDAFGAVTLQNNAACPKGTRQQRQVIESPPPMPAYRPVPMPMPAPDPAPPATVADSVPATPVIADSERLPPPALYQCNTYDHDSYLSETSTPEPRCVRLQTTNLEGAADDAAGVACQMVTDQCQRVGDGAACDSWKQRLRETEAAWKFARPDDAEANKAEFERVRKIVRESTCGK
ncbi:DUF4124 domain-containing protein [Cognatiluteimonas profundi]|uniref:DUF4124 domain-containing protein n=1 Tax=Cognatiluteimonas profundi TaxID=2594501 RepID=UPI00131BDE6C|nr:DUF4124 domain-containing protein [Lysobacter profundi]